MNSSIDEFNSRVITHDADERPEVVHEFANLEMFDRPSCDLRILFFFFRLKGILKHLHMCVIRAQFKINDSARPKRF